MPDNDLIRADEVARKAALAVDRSFIVQAPAGSGKTELLIQRYLRLLATVDNPEEVLAITFTRKAAAEMQLRVLQALLRAAADEAPEAEHDRVTLDAAKSVLQRDSAQEWQLSRNPRRMRIQTLDSLNGSIARSQPVTSTAGATGFAIVTDAGIRSLYREAAAATLDQLAETGELSAATVEVLAHVDNNAWLYIDYLERMLATRDQWLPFVGSGAIDGAESAHLRQRFENTLELVVTRELESVRNAIPSEVAADLVRLIAYAADNLASAGRDDSDMVALAGIAELPPATPDHLPLWQGVAEFLLTRQGGVRKRVNKNVGFPAGDDGQKDEFERLLDVVVDVPGFSRLLHGVRSLPPVTYTDEQWSVLLALFRLLPLAVTELKRFFADRGMTDHIEVALSAAGALGTAEEPGDLALLLDYQIRHILVDEMQDTSSAQYRMIEALTGGWTEGDGRTLFCVGDPMQSIYRFRNAEVGQFLLARECGIGNLSLEALTLRRNFRSGEKLVDWFNAVFANMLPQQNSPQESAVAYSEAVAAPARHGVGEVVVHALVDGDARAEADMALNTIRTTLDAHRDDDMVVLVRSRTHLPELLFRLRATGISYRAVEIDRLTDLPEIIDVLALTRAIVHLGDRHAWLALLRSPWVGLHWTDLHALVMNEPRNAIWDLIGNSAALSRMSDDGRDAVIRCRERLSRILNSYRIETLRDRVERAWIDLGGPAIVADSYAIDNVYRFLDVLERCEVGGDLPDVAELEAILDAEHVSSNADARLQIMTMHRAKGLQFDHVLLFGLGRVPRARDRHVMSWFDVPDEHGEPHKVIGPVGRRADVENDVLHTYINNMEAGKDGNELARLLYVACTRARKSLHLSGSAYQRRDGVLPAKRSLLQLLWPAVADDYVATTAPEAVPDSDSEDWMLPELRRFPKPWQVPDARPLPGAPSSGTDETPVEYYWVGAGARLAGTLAHRWIQLAIAGQVDLGTENFDVIRRMSGRWLSELGIAGPACGPIIARVEAALRGIGNDDKGRWLLRGDGYAELALTGAYGNSVESVVLDRVRIDEDGTHWIIDYKTSSHEGGDRAAFLDAEAERYRAQLTRYSEIYGNWLSTGPGTRIRCALYFPLLQEFVEVAV